MVSSVFFCTVRIHGTYLSSSLLFVFSRPSLISLITLSSLPTNLHFFSLSLLSFSLFTNTDPFHLHVLSFSFTVCFLSLSLLFYFYCVTSSRHLLFFSLFISYSSFSSLSLFLPLPCSRLIFSRLLSPSIDRPRRGPAGGHCGYP